MLVGDGGEGGRGDQEDERGPPPDVEEDGPEQPAPASREPRDMDAQPAQHDRHRAALGGIERDAEIADRDPHREQRGGEDAAKDPAARRAQADQPGKQHADDEFRGHRDGDIDPGDGDAVPERSRFQHRHVIGEADIAGDAAAQHVGGKAVMHHRDQREERECDHPQHGGQQHHVFEAAPVVETSAHTATLGHIPLASLPGFGATVGNA